MRSIGIGGNAVIDFHNRSFICVAAAECPDFTTETVFHFKQYGDIVHATYNGGNIQYGELIGMVDQQGIQQVIFNHDNMDFQCYSGTCTFTPERLHDKSYVLHGQWFKTEEDTASKELTLEELR